MYQVFNQDISLASVTTCNVRQHFKKKKKRKNEFTFLGWDNFLFPSVASQRLNCQNKDLIFH